MFYFERKGVGGEGKDVNTSNVIRKNGKNKKNVENYVEKYVEKNVENKNVF